MTFHDIELDRAYSYGSLITEQGNTAVIQLASGQEERIQRWNDTQVVANLGYAVKTYAELQALLKFKRARGHRAHSFRFWNPLDYSTNAANTPNDTSTSLVTATDQTLGLGDGTTTTFQLVKRYVSGSQTVIKNITKPISGSVKIAWTNAGVDTTKTEGTHFTVNYTTGVVTFTSGNIPTVNDTVRGGCQFNEEMRFESDDSSVSIESFERGDIAGGLRIISVMSPVLVNDDFVYRGSSRPSFTADMDLTPQMGAFVAVDPSSAGLKLKLPSTAGVPEGGPHWKLRNLSATNTFLVTDSAGVTLFTMQVAGDANRRDTCEVWLSDTGSALEWMAVT